MNTIPENTDADTGEDSTVSVEKLRSSLRNLLPELKERYPIASLGLFGFYVRGEADEKSDIDILVEFNGKIGYFGFADLEEDLTRHLGVKVDLVDRRGLKPHIGERILREVEMI